MTDWKKQAELDQHFPIPQPINLMEVLEPLAETIAKIKALDIEAELKKLESTK